VSSDFLTYINAINDSENISTARGKVFAIAPMKDWAGKPQKQQICRRRARIVFS
jgi:hypothetical protein